MWDGAKENKLEFDPKDKMASIVVLQIGQCGNQLGYQFFHDIFDESCSASAAHRELFLSTYFHQTAGAQNLIIPC